MGGGQKGFTLVELIVVIVILAILVGVTIGGIFHYINEVRKSVDINNVNTINNAIQKIRYSKELDDIFGQETRLKFYRFEWTTNNNVTISFQGDKNFTSDAKNKLMNLVESTICETFPDGFPKLNTSDCAYRIELYFGSTGDRLLDIYCGVYNGAICGGLASQVGIPVISDWTIDNVKYYKRVY